MQQIFPGRFNDGSGLFWLHDLFWLLIVVALVIGAFLVVRAVLDRPKGPPGAGGWPVPAAALHELDLRYARGEIDRAEYLQRRADLLGQHGPQGGPPTTPPPATPPPATPPPTPTTPRTPTKR